jgi:dihydropteroate synthase
MQLGIARENIVLDPGFGFGKRYEENFPLLAHFEQLAELGFPLLAGTSRKGFIGRTLRNGEEEAPVTERLYGTIATVAAAILAGAHIIRVHDVKPAVDAARVADEILKARS